MLTLQAGTPCTHCQRRRQECIRRSAENVAAMKVLKPVDAKHLDFAPEGLPACRSTAIIVPRPHHQRPSQHESSIPDLSPQPYAICKSPTQYDDHYFLSILFHVLFPTALRQDYTERTWPGYLALSHGRDSLSYQCLRSLSQACTGQVARFPELIVSAQRQYTACLRELHLRLADAQARYDEDLLLPISIFGAYELLFLTTGDGWIQHSFGLAALFELRGPEAFTPHGTAIQVFKNCRQVMIMAALSARKRTFLSRKEWITRPWAVSKMPRDIFERLLDIVVHLPDLTVRCLKIDDDDTKASIHRDALDLLAQLGEWRVEWSDSPHSQDLPLRLSSCLSQPYPHECLGPPLGYPSKYAATTDSLYQGAVVFVSNFILTTLPAGMDGAAGIVLGIQHAAREICRGLPYFMTSPHSHRSRLDSLWSLHLAWKVLGGLDSPLKLREWLRRQADDTASTFGSWLVSPKDLAQAIRES